MIKRQETRKIRLSFEVYSEMKSTFEYKGLTKHFTGDFSVDFSNLIKMSNLKNSDLEEMLSLINNLNGEFLEIARNILKKELELRKTNRHF